jgi:putative endonuclease
MVAYTRQFLPAVYILASKRNGTLYIGVTSDLAGRVSIHKQDLVAGFTSRYGVHSLVWYELHETMPQAIGREKQLKKLRRAEKIALIEAMNADWRDLYEDIRS